MTATRYPAQRLADELHVSLWQMFDQVGVSGRTARQARDEGFTELQADRYAARVGLSAYSVWPELVDDLIDTESRACAADGCEERFVPGNPRRLYCSTTCRDRRAKSRWRRNRYRADPEFREQVKAESRERYERERDYIRRQQNARRKSSTLNAAIGGVSRETVGHPSDAQMACAEVASNASSTGARP